MLNFDCLPTLNDNSQNKEALVFLVADISSIFPNIQRGER